jgi:D-sedoheptulose 7-phosphate isomerase
MALPARAQAFSTVIESVQISGATGTPVETEPTMQQVVAELLDIRARGGMIYFAGNGGSAAVAGHAVTDFMNVGRFRAMALHDASLLTCMANDYGYEHAFARMLSTLARPGDLLVAISSSGRSPNICNAAKCVREREGRVLTLSGFAPDNPLRSLGDYNVWLNSTDYGMVEMGHQFILHNLTDRLLR